MNLEKPSDVPPTSAEAQPHGGNPNQFFGRRASATLPPGNLLKFAVAKGAHCASPGAGERQQLRNFVILEPYFRDVVISRRVRLAHRRRFPQE